MTQNQQNQESQELKNQSNAVDSSEAVKPVRISVMRVSVIGNLSTYSTNVSDTLRDLKATKKTIISIDENQLGAEPNALYAANIFFEEED